MSWLKRKGPSEVEVAKANEIKRGITDAVSKALKAVQKENINTEDRAVYSTEIANAVCSALEAVFLHGLRASSAKKIANLVGLGHQDRTAEQSLNFWRFVSKFTHGEVIAQLKHLGQITTEIGFCRAWVRLGLNDCLMESYLDAMTSDKKTLEYFYHRTAYLRDSEHPGILRAYLQGLMAFEFKLSYNSSVLNEWSYAPLILAGIIESDDSPLPVIKPSASKVLVKEPSVQENSSVEVSRVRARSRGGSDGKDRKSKHEQREQHNPMENPTLGRPADNAYYVTGSNFTSKDVEEIKNRAKKSNPESEVSSSSQVSAPDSPHLNLSPADYVRKDYRNRSHSNKSSSTNRSSELNEVDHLESVDRNEIKHNPELFKIDIADDQVKNSNGSSVLKTGNARKLLNRYTPAEKSYVESLPPIKNVLEDFLKELYSDVQSDTTDSKMSIDSNAEIEKVNVELTQNPSNVDDSRNYRNYSSLRRLESINTEVKEDAILSDILSEENYSITENEKKSNVLEEWEANHPEGFKSGRNDVIKEVYQSPNASIISESCVQDSQLIEASGDRVNLNVDDENRELPVRNTHEEHVTNSYDKISDLDYVDASNTLKSEQHAESQPSPLTESNLKQLNEELDSLNENSSRHSNEEVKIVGHFEDKVHVNLPSAPIKKGNKQTSPKRKSEKRRQSKGHLKPNLSPPNAEPLKPQLSPAKAETIDTFHSNLEPRSNHRHSLPTSSLLYQSSQETHRQSMPNILEGATEVSDTVSNSNDLTERLREIYDGKPIQEESNDHKDGDTINEDDIPVVSNEPRQSVGNSLIWSGRGWSSSFEHEMDDTIEPLSPPRNDRAIPVTGRPKAESFGSLLQNYTPSSSLSAPSIDEVLHNFPRKETIITPPSTPPMKKQDSVEEFEIVTNLDCPDSNMVARLTQLSEIANEKGLDAQNFQCKGCTRPLGLILGKPRICVYDVFGKPRICVYDGGYYCFECHENDEYYIPARIVHNWDFRKHKVAKKNLEFLQEVEEQPHIDIEEANPRLYDHVPEIQEIKKLRTQLIHLKTYLFTCKQSSAEDFRRLIWPRDYLCENVELYSLADLLQVPSGALAASLRKVIKFATKHVYGCRLCSQKGFICELCNNQKVIYAFEMDATFRCPQCKSVYHKECKTDNRPCPKCQRRLLREAAHGLEPTTHDLASQYLHTR